MPVKGYDVITIKSDLGKLLEKAAKKLKLKTRQDVIKHLLKNANIK